MSLVIGHWSEVGGRRSEVGGRRSEGRGRGGGGGKGLGRQVRQGRPGCEGHQDAAKLVRGAVALGSFLGKDFQQDLFQFVGEPGNVGAQVGNAGFEVQPGKLGGIIRLVGQPAGKHFVEHHAQGIYIRCGRRSFPRSLLGGEILRRPPDDFGVFIRADGCQGADRRVWLSGSILSSTPAARSSLVQERPIST